MEAELARLRQAEQALRSSGATDHPDIDSRHDVGQSPVRFAIHPTLDLKAEHDQVGKVLQNANLFEALFENAGLGMGLVDLLEGKILYANAKLAAILGYSREELCRMAFPQITHPADIAADWALYQELLAGQRQEFQLEKRYLHADGTIIQANLTVSLIRTTSGEPIFAIGMIEDITARKRAEEALRASEERFRLLADNVQEVFFLANPPQNKVFYISPAYEKIWGRSLESLYADPHSFLDSIHEEDRPRVRGSLAKQVWTGGQPMDIEYRIIRPDGSLRWIRDRTFPLKDADGAIYCIAGIATDISSYKLAVSTLQQQVMVHTAELEQISILHQAILDHTELAIIVITVDGVIQVINPAAERMLGYSAREVIGRMTPERFHDPTEVEQYTAALAAARDESITPGFAALLEYARQNLLTLHDWTFIHQDGSRFPVQLAICTLQNRRGETIGLVGLAQDISERKRAELRLHEALEREQELSKLKSRLVSMASHEFRTPRSTILATTETLAAYRDRMSAELIDGRLEKIRRQTLRLKNIIEAVLSLSRLQAGQAPLNLMTADLDALCQEVVSEFQHQPDMRHRLLYTCNRQPFLVSMDPKLMVQVVSNLISNAIKYSPEAENIYIELTLMAGNAILYVRDQGIGIPEVDRKHLFEPFHRGTNVGTIAGLGLGLSLVKQIVELHHGMIVVDSQPGRGTTISISIPTLKE